MQFVDALAKLSFSFWQVVVVVAIVMFRRELREMVRRIATFKVAGSEITWNPKSDAVEALAQLKSQVESADHSSEQVVGLIDAKIHNRVLLALANLKRGTTYLWPALVEAKTGSRISVPIRAQTLNRVGPDLEALRASGVLKYEVEFDKDNPDGVHALVIGSVSEALSLMVHEVEKAY